MAEDASGNHWFATNGGGLAYLYATTGKFSSFRHDPEDPGSIGSNVVRRVLVDNVGTVWAGLRDGGLSRLDTRTGTFSHYRFTSDVGADIVYALVQDSSGTIWAGGDHGLSRIDPDSTEVTTLTGTADDVSSLSPHSVRAIFEDSNGTIWAGTFGGGLHRFEAETGAFVRYTHDAADESTITGDKVTAIFEDRGGRFWVGTTDGLNLLDRSGVVDPQDQRHRPRCRVRAAWIGRDVLFAGFGRYRLRGSTGMPAYDD